MKCFRHRAIDAVGFCKVCCKGLCRRCGTDLGHSFTCRGHCAAEAERLEKEWKVKLAKLDEQAAQVEHWEARAETLLRRASVRAGGRLFVPALLLLTGVPFLALGISRAEMFAATLGGGFVVMAIVYFWINARAAASADGA